MELLGVIVALEALKRPCQVELYSDSKYVVDAFNQKWVSGWIRKGWKTASKEPVKNVDLWKRLLSAMEDHEVSFKWVKGHAGHPLNERCDQLATEAADGSNLLDDQGFFVDQPLLSRTCLDEKLFSPYVLSTRKQPPEWAAVLSCMRRLTVSNRIRHNQQGLVRCGQEGPSQPRHT